MSNGFRLLHQQQRPKSKTKKRKTRISQVERLSCSKLLRSPLRHLLPFWPQGNAHHFRRSGSVVQSVILFLKKQSPNYRVLNLQEMCIPKSADLNAHL